MDEHQQYYDYAEGRDKRFFESNDDESINAVSSTSICTDDADNGNESNYEPAHSVDSYDFETSQNFVDPDHDDSYYSEEDFEEDDDSLGFPPGHITTLDEMHELKLKSFRTSNNDSGRGSNNDGKHPSVNASIIPSYFFCPLTETIMKDPVITPDGTTFERRAILRSLILQPCNPVTGTPLSHTDLVDDQLVRTSIDKARKEAWIRYVVEFRDDDAEKVYEEKVIEKQAKKRSEIHNPSLDAITAEESNRKQPTVPTPRVNDPQPSSPDGNISVSSATLNSAYDPALNHGWLVPLGVHTIVCSSPGLIVTADFHRRSKVVKRRILKKALVGGERNKQKKKSIKKRIGHAVSPRKHRTENDEYTRRVKNIKTITTAATQDLVLPPRSHVEISETRIHGGRVRGKICWEEEVTVELDADLVDELKRQEEVVEMMTKVRVSKGENTRKKAFFRRKQDKTAVEKAIAQSVPYSSDLSSNEIPPPAQRQAKKDRSPSPLTTIKYSGWISLQWAGGVGNHEKDEAMRRRRNEINVLKEHKVDDYHPHLIADEDDGPWSRPLSLGVYRIIGMNNLPVSDVPEKDSNSIGMLKSGDVVEVVETKVVIMKRKSREPRNYLSMLTSDFEVIRTVRARCMMSSDSATTKRFKSGWITLCEEDKKSNGENIVTASPIPVGAHVVTSKQPLISYSGSQIKTILPSGSCMEVDATRLEFDESTTVKCDCGQESSYPVIAVKALISLGGYATLFTLPVGKSSPCACGQEVVAKPTRYAEPVELGVYKVVHPNGVFLTEGICPNTPIITTLKQNAFADVIETRVEDGCVRGKIKIFLSCDLSETGDKNTGWISLFEPPSFVWAELVSNKKEV